MFKKHLHMKMHHIRIRFIININPHQLSQQMTLITQIYLYVIQIYLIIFSAKLKGSKGTLMSRNN